MQSGGKLQTNTWLFTKNMSNHYPKLAEKNECTGCLACVDCCNNSAIDFYINKDGHYYVRINKDLCVGCLLCEKTCPVATKLKYGESECSCFYAAWNKDDVERGKSASGGVFSAMAHYVIDRGGIVVGAATENVCDVKHVVVCDKEGIKSLQGSKYTQSDTTGIYQKSYRLLKEGKTVLFSGTGCQVGGLLSYLKNKKYEGILLTVDLICGGVPSKLLLQKFIENEPFDVKRILSYRTKENGWKPKGFVYNMKVEDKGGNVHDYAGKHNLVTTGFSTEMTERYSCYDCKFVGKHRLSDYTIGDLWGDTEYPQEHYKGLSLVVAHNHQAEVLLKGMESYLQTVPCNELQAVKMNPRLVNGKSGKKNMLERKYMELLFSRCSYQTLKKIYANDFSSYSPWMGWKVIRDIYLKVMNIICN